MTRSQIVQSAINVTRGRRYLEIGVFKRENFNQIVAEQKIAVDPAYLHPNKYLSRIFQWLPFLGAGHRLLKQKNGQRYFQMTSSRFFEKHGTWLKDNPLDVCFIDGKHTYDQSLEDVTNALKHMGPSGVIVMHDCNPTSKAMAYPANSLSEAIKMDLPGWTGEWCGDVWKTIVHLRSQCPDLRVCVLDTDCGVGLVVKGRSENMLTHSKEDIQRMTYEDLDAARERLLNLKDPEYVHTFLKSL